MSLRAAKAIEAKKNVQNYVIPDSDKERDLTEEMELDYKVVVYAKLPRGLTKNSCWSFNRL